MSSSQNTPDPNMMEFETPDSPPASQTQSPLASFSKQQPLSPQQPQSNTGASRTNGEGNSKSNFGAPGSSWQSKKFTEEYERAQNSVVDKDWDHTRFGDPLMQD